MLLFSYLFQKAESCLFSPLPQFSFVLWLLLVFDFQKTGLLTFPWAYFFLPLRFSWGKKQVSESKLWWTGRGKEQLGGEHWVQFLVFPTCTFRLCFCFHFKAQMEKEYQVLSKGFCIIYTVCNRGCKTTVFYWNLIISNHPAHLEVLKFCDWLWCSFCLEGCLDDLILGILTVQY